MLRTTARRLKFREVCALVCNAGLPKSFFSRSYPEPESVHGPYRRLLWLFLAAVFCLGARAETFKAPDPGPGAVPITGTWQFHTGDDLAWANPAFNDSGWQAIKADQPWGAQGHPGYTGYAWYRKRLDIGAGDKPLGLFIPESDGAYEVYWNGQRIGSSGSLPPHAVWYVAGQNAVFPLSGNGATTGVLALRFWAPPASTASDPTDGGLHGAPRLGRVSLLQQQLQFAPLLREQRYLTTIIAAALTGAGVLLSLLLFLRRRGDWLYLWLALLLLSNVITVADTLSNRSLSFVPEQMLVQLYQVCGAVGLWLTLLWIFGLNTSRRWRVITGVVIGVFLTAQFIDCTCLWFWQDAGPGIVHTDLVTTEIYTALGFFSLFLVGFGMVRQKVSSLVPLALIAAIYGAWDPVLNFAGLIWPATAARMGNFGWELGTYKFGVITLLSWLLILTLAVTVVRRQLAEGRRQAHLEGEMRSAQEIQHILIPEEIPSVPGLAVSSVYKPAAEVGGDFFQIIPPDPDASQAGALGTLIVVGDVSGKGLKAAMTVSLIVGTLRTLADATRSPAAILTGLNRRLLGRTQGGFATCLVLRLDADGTATLANAGHLSPFRDGVEWDVPASLPLGLAAEADYDEVHTRLGVGETLTLITDGVLEARNREGELYGFDRVAALMRERPNAEQVAEAACAFGQDDDITVLSVTREAVREPALVNGLRTVGA